MTLIIQKFYGKTRLRMLFSSFRMLALLGYWQHFGMFRLQRSLRETQKWMWQAKGKAMNEGKHLFTLIHC